MATIKKFEDLEIRQRARQLCKEMEVLFQTTEIEKIRSFGIKWKEVQVLFWTI